MPRRLTPAGFRDSIMPQNFSRGLFKVTRTICPVFIWWQPLALYRFSANLLKELQTGYHADAMVLAPGAEDLEVVKSSLKKRLLDAQPHVFVSDRLLHACMNFSCFGLQVFERWMTLGRDQ